MLHLSNIVDRINAGGNEKSCPGGSIHFYVDDI
jgi:hypothetical protein